MASQPNPPSRARTLVLCFDGTSNEYDADNTNVVKFFSLLRKDNSDEQLCYYQAGIGTYFQPGVVSPLFEWGAKILDLAFAWYLDAHVMDGYKFLMQNYCSGDKICIFGFSRGAYTARALGGLLFKVGLLSKDNESQIPFAYRMYKRTDAAGVQLCAGFKQTYCQSVKVDFMGVWDTVASVGVITGRTLPFTNSNSSIKTFRHGLSLDEHRAKFRPNNYHRPAPNEEARRLDPEHGSSCPSPTKSSGSGSNGSSVEEGNSAQAEKKRSYWRWLGHKQNVTTKYTGKSISPVLVEEGEEDDVLEVWFSGCHSDVGGGAVTNDTSSSLANISLRWMVREVVSSGCGILFDVNALLRANITLNAEPTTAEVDMDMADALQPLHDELKLNRLWWLLELIPLQYAYQDADGVWHREWNIHFGRGRKIMDRQPKFHASVQKRMSSPLKYTPKARWEPGTEVYVE